MSFEKKGFALLIVLMTLNALAYMWSQGHFDEWVINTGQTHDPVRMTQEILPNSIQINGP
jgi:hypothetical protein